MLTHAKRFEHVLPHLPLFLAVLPLLDPEVLLVHLVQHFLHSQLLLQGDVFLATLLTCPDLACVLVLLLDLLGDQVLATSASVSAFGELDNDIRVYSRHQALQVVLLRHALHLVVAWKKVLL